ncbi:MAG: aminotransferase class V-fold PLP-dependent enzyme [bacterium]|nr:aminotransferase class V-fold PLP-dependent enzyme [bacterium]
MSGAESLFCDFNAGAPAEAAVLEEFVTAEREAAGNPASVHAPGRRARGVLETARARIAAALGVEHDEIVFTSGGTEAANLAVRGLGNPQRPVLHGPVEHPAVAEPAAERGHVPWPVDPTGRVEVEDPQQRVGLVALVHGQSELGTLQPIVAARAVATTCDVPLFVDAAQTLGRVRLTEVIEHADAIALSPHKCGGLRGHGVLVVRRSAGAVQPLLRGGAQEQGLRAGTPSPALAAANALAIELAIQELDARHEAMAHQRERFLTGLRRSDVDHRVLTPLASSLPNTAMVAFSGIDGRNLLPVLDLAGVHASHGSACASGSPTPPPILRAIGLDERSARACVRFSLGWHSTAADLERFGHRAGDAVRDRCAKN